MANPLFCLIVLLIVFTSPALAQKRVKEELKVRRIPLTETAPPKSRLYSAKRVPSNSLKLYAATAKGLQKSEDGGQSWEPLAVSGTYEKVFALAVHPLNPDTLYIGRRDGLWKSRDGGLSWSPMSYPEPVPLAVAIAKSQPDILYLATSRRGIHKSTDGGYRWVAANNGLPEARAGGRPEEIRTLVVDPNDPNVAYAGLARHGVYRTVDGGQNWQMFNEGLPFIMGGPLNPPKLAFDPENPDDLYLVFNQRIHSRLIRTRLYVMSNNEEWHPTEIAIPAIVPVLDLTIDRPKRTIQLWGADFVMEIPLLEKSGTNP